MKKDKWGNIHKIRILQKKGHKRRWPKWKAWRRFIKEANQ